MKEDNGGCLKREASPREKIGKSHICGAKQSTFFYKILGLGMGGGHSCFMQMENCLLTLNYFLSPI